MRRIINSTYISLDGVIQDPQDWPDNGIEPDDTGLKVQTDLLFACDAVLMGGLTYPAMAAAWMARSGDPYSDRINSMTKYVVSSTLRDPEWPNATVADLMFRPTATAQLDLAGTLALNTGTVILTYRAPSRP